VKIRKLLPAALALAALPALSALAADADAVQHNLDVVWTLIAGILVFTMQAGFALVETGMTRAKNAANIMMKNIFDFVLGSIAFFLVGYALMMGPDVSGVVGWGNFLMQSALGDGASWDWTFMFFMTMFAATSATIVSGAMAERTKFTAYLVYSVAISLLVYPVSGHWAWGALAGEGSAGWLSKLSTGAFHDFAGSTVVHSVGGWIALAGAMALGPRIGKFRPDGKPVAILGHNLVLGTLGVFLLWIGWFGFNPGSTCVGDGSIGRIAMTTNLAACAGAAMAMAVSWKLFGKPDLSMSLNGALAGLVAITAGCDTVTMVGSLAIGAVAGVLVVFSVLFIERVLKIDDPVGAVSVHCVNGVWGTLAVGLFGAEKVLGTAEESTGLFYGGGCAQLASQAIGVVAVGAWAFVCGLAMFQLIKKTIGLRASEEEELKGMDMAEHNNDAYAGFQIFLNE
jgi:Amt family ammonium transporter